MSNRDAGPEHQCRQGRKCKARIKDAEGKFHGAGVERPDSLCRPCEEHAFAAIRQLGTDYNHLAGERIDPQRVAAAGPKVSGSTERPIPISLAADTLMTEIDDETMRWVLRVTKGDPLPTYPQERVHHCVKILGANLGTLVDMPLQVVPAWFPYPDGGDWDGRMELDGVDAILRLARLHYRVQNVLGVTETTMFLPDPCPHCARKALAASKDQEQVACKACGIVWDSKHFALLSNVLDFERQAVMA